MKNCLCLFSVIACLLFNTTLFAQNTIDNNSIQQIQTQITLWMADYKIPGVAVGLYYKGQDYYFNFGVANKSTSSPVTKNTIFELASVGKTLTATLLGICIEQNKCHLNDSVNRYIPQFAQDKNAAINQVTLQQLATHTSGLPRSVNDLGTIDLQASNANEVLIHKLMIWQPDKPVGTQYLYSNIGFGLLGKVVTQAMDIDYLTAYSQYIFNPLHMTKSYVNVPNNELTQFAQGYNRKGNSSAHYPPTVWPGGGSMSSTSSDMLQFLKAELGVGQLNKNTLTQAMQLTQQSYLQLKPNLMQGLAWQRLIKDHILIIRKKGMNKGFNNYVAFVPQQKIAIVILTNKRGDKPDKIANQILQELS